MSFSSPKVQADEISLDLPSCTGVLSTTPWNGPKTALVSVGANVFTVTYNWRIGPGGIVEVEVTIVTQIGGTPASGSDYEEAKKLGYIEAWGEVSWDAYKIIPTYVTERSCWERLSLGEGVHSIKINVGDLVYNPSNITVNNYVVANPASGGVFEWDIIGDPWRGCAGSVCCSVVMDLTTDIYSNIVEVKFVEAWGEAPPTCDAQMSPLACVANCDNLEWDWTASGGFSKQSFGFNVENKLLTISPNPSDGLFHIEFANEFTGDFEIKILDNTGKLVSTYSMNKTVNEFSTELDLQEMNSGFYIVSISLDGVIYSHKLMIK